MTGQEVSIFAPSLGSHKPNPEPGFVPSHKTWGLLDPNPCSSVY